MTEKQLWLLRHARADAGGERLEDIDRPLSHHGREQAGRLGEWMHARGLRPGLVVSSPAIRARQTSELVCRPLGIDINHIHYDPGLYLASRDNLLMILAEWAPQAGSIMLVGHNPGLEELLNWLCAEPLPRNSEGQLLTTANLARIQLAADGEYAEASSQLIELTRADELA